jgi:hypothetical protein
MAFQAVPETAQITIVYTYNDEPCVNTLYAKKPGGYALGDLTALAEQIDVQVGTTWLNLQPPEASYVRTEVRGLDEENDLLVEENDNAGPGTGSANSTPNQVTFAIRKNSGKTGRSARGRLYWIGLPRDKLDPSDENRILQAHVDDLVDAVDDQRVGIDAVAGWEAVLVSRFKAGLKRDEGVTFPWVSTGAVDNIVDTQRGRLPK